MITRMDELCERDTARWISQLLSALEHMHGLHIAHCDVKPENVLLVSGGGGGSRAATKLSDFGCARRVGVAGASAAPQGSRGYAAPEQRAGSCPVASSVDLWGLGVLSVRASDLLEHLDEHQPPDTTGLLLAWSPRLTMRSTCSQAPCYTYYGHLTMAISHGFTHYRSTCSSPARCPSSQPTTRRPASSPSSSPVLRGPPSRPR